MSSSVKHKVLAVMASALLAVGVIGVSATASSAATAVPFTFTLDKSSPTSITVDGKRVYPGKSITVKSAAPKLFFGTTGSHYCRYSVNQTITYKNGQVKKTSFSTSQVLNSTSWGSTNVKSAKVSIKLTSCEEKKNVTVRGTDQSKKNVRMSVGTTSRTKSLSTTVRTTVNKPISLNVKTSRPCQISAYSKNSVVNSTSYTTSKTFSLPYSADVKFVVKKCK